MVASARHSRPDRARDDATSARAKAEATTALEEIRQGERDDARTKSVGQFEMLAARTDHVALVLRPRPEGEPSSWSRTFVLDLARRILRDVGEDAVPADRENALYRRIEDLRGDLGDDFRVEHERVADVVLPFVARGTERRTLAALRDELAAQSPRRGREPARPAQDLRGPPAARPRQAHRRSDPRGEQSRRPHEREPRRGRPQQRQPGARAMATHRGARVGAGLHRRSASSPVSRSSSLPSSARPSSTSSRTPQPPRRCCGGLGGPARQAHRLPDLARLLDRGAGARRLLEADDETDPLGGVRRREEREAPPPAVRGPHGPLLVGDPDRAAPAPPRRGVRGNRQRGSPACSDSSPPGASRSS